MLNISFFTGHAPDSGWTAYPPLSTMYSAGQGMDYYSIGLQIAGIGTLLGAINFIVTIMNMRAPGMTLHADADVLLDGFHHFDPDRVRLLGVRCRIADADASTVLFDGNFFDPTAGGNVILWQHIFWIFGHPEVYILILPAFGILSEVIPRSRASACSDTHRWYLRRRSIGFLGFMVWAHHMFTVGMGSVANTLFAIATMLIAVPTGIKIFNWIFTIWKGSFKFNAPSLFAVGFIPMFTMGGVTGVMLGSRQRTISTMTRISSSRTSTTLS